MWVHGGLRCPLEQLKKRNLFPLYKWISPRIFDVDAEKKFLAIGVEEYSAAGVCLACLSKKIGDWVYYIPRVHVDRAYYCGSDCRIGLVFAQLDAVALVIFHTQKSSRHCRYAKAVSVLSSPHVDRMGHVLESHCPLVLAGLSGLAKGPQSEARCWRSAAVTGAAVL